MIEGKASETAKFVAILRAHHFAFAPDPKILSDNIAGPLIGLNSPDEIAAHMEGIVGSFAALTDRGSAELFIDRVVQTVCMRSRVTEERLKIARARGLEQVVVLGAGLDSMAYRLGEHISDLQFFEIDHPDTQAGKKACLADAGIAIPDNLTFVPFDFERQTLQQALEGGGVDTNKVSLFPWLGVNMYLSNDAVQSTLDVVAKFPKGSELTMDFVPPNASLDAAMEPDGVEKLGQIVSQMGEPFKSFFTPESLDRRLRVSGFSETILYKTQDLVDQYLNGDKSKFNMASEAAYLASAVV